MEEPFSTEKPNKWSRFINRLIRLTRKTRKSKKRKVKKPIDEQSTKKLLELLDRPILADVEEPPPLPPRNLPPPPPPPLPPRTNPSKIDPVVIERSGLLDEIRKSGQKKLKHVDLTSKSDDDENEFSIQKRRLRHVELPVKEIQTPHHFILQEEETDPEWLPYIDESDIRAIQNTVSNPDNQKHTPIDHSMQGMQQEINFTQNELSKILSRRQALEDSDDETDVWTGDGMINRSYLRRKKPKRRTNAAMRAKMAYVRSFKRK